MILGEHMLQRAYPGEYPPSQWATGFGLLPRCGIAPHFDTFGDTWINKIKQTLPAGATLIGIDEQTAYVRHGDHDWTILGHGQVTLHTL